MLLRSSRLLVRDCFGEIWSALTSGGTVTLEMRARVRASRRRRRHRAGLGHCAADGSGRARAYRQTLDKRSS